MEAFFSSSSYSQTIFWVIQYDYFHTVLKNQQKCLFLQSDILVIFVKHKVKDPERSTPLSSRNLYIANVVKWDF